MPCGGIEPYSRNPNNNDPQDTIQHPLDATEGGCLYCGRGGCKHFVIEWDAFIHARCALKFLLETDEGKCIIAHKHTVVLEFDLEEENAYEQNKSKEAN